MSDKIEASRRMVDATKQLYLALLSKPLPDKQLLRPPFNFIQGLVKSLVIETRILRDVFSPADFDTKKRNWDRPMKVEFIQKLIDFVARNDHPVVGCVASKVVAGLDPNKTLELLQGLASITQRKLSVSDDRRPRTFIKQSSTEQISPRPSPTEIGSKSSLAIKNQSSSLSGQHRDATKKSTPIQSGRQPERKPGTQTNVSNMESRSIRPGKLKTSTPPPTTSRLATLPETPSATLELVLKPAEQQVVAQRGVVSSNATTVTRVDQPHGLGKFSDRNVLVGNDYDHNNLQHLRANLKSLRSNLDYISVFEDSLRSALTMSVSFVAGN